MSQLPELMLPTPLIQLRPDGSRGELWVKQDGLIHPMYGGNKARKVTGLLREAMRRGADRILTIGAAGSHHVLATTLFAKQAGLRTAAVLTPQPATPHARSVLSHALDAGVEAIPAPSSLGVLWALLSKRRAHDYFVPPGGSNAIGSSAYAGAIQELERQLDASDREPPDVIVVPLGSGGTAAGLLAGLATSRLPTRLIAVSVLGNPLAAWWVRWLAQRVLQLTARRPTNSTWKARLTLDNTQIGRGYGYATEAGGRASDEAAALGLVLDPTYTAKAFAAALALVRDKRGSNGSPMRVLYWHTLSTTPDGDPGTAALTPELERLLVTKGD